MFHAGLRGLGSNNFWNSSYKEKTAGSVSVSRLSSVSYDYGNKKLNPIVTELFIRGRKTKHFSCYYYKILFSCAKFYALFYYKNSKQKRTSTNCI